MKPLYLRTIDDLKRGCTYPFDDHGLASTYEHHIMGRCKWAIEDILRRLPEPEYAVFRERMRTTLWFIPFWGLWGAVKPLRQSAMIYISPFTQFLTDKGIAGLVVHELAHLIIGHLEGGVAWKDQERAVNQAVREWGFADEADACDEETQRFSRNLLPQSHPPIDVDEFTFL